MRVGSKKALLKSACLLIAIAGSMCPLLVFGQERAQVQQDSSPIIVTVQQPAQKKDDQPQPKDTPPQPPAPDTPAAVEKERPIFGGSTPSSGTTGSSVVTPAALPTGGDAGSVLANTSAGTGIDVQQRAPLSMDPRIRGYHIGEVVSNADGAFWTAARIDLDTALGKINAEDIDNIAVFKGPYSVRYGPGFAFLDITTTPTPRSTDGCFDVHGSTSLLFKSNGDAFAGRQSIFGGGSDWGFRLSYDILAANDYHEGGGTTLPSSYNSQNVNFAIGFDLATDSHLEFKYLRQMQNNVDYPGLLTDINQMNTDGVSVRYVQEKATLFDKFTVDAWYNTTSFGGDSSQESTRLQIPQLNGILRPASDNPNNVNADNVTYFNAGGLQVRLDLTTQARLATWGTREAVTWGEDKGVQLTVGTDLTVVRQQYNEFDSFNFSPPDNFGIPASQSVDVGMFVDGTLPIGDRLTLRAGARMDFVNTDILYLGYLTNAQEYVQTVGYDSLATQHFLLGSAFGTADYKLTDELTLVSGYGFAQRPPTLTELYTGGAFFGLIQNGFNAIYGNPDLSPEQLNQFDLGLKVKDDDFRGGIHGFYAMVNNYITYEANPFNQGDGRFTIPFPATPPQFPQALNLQTELRQYRFKNTSLATLTGFEVYGEYDLYSWLTPFANVSYVQRPGRGDQRAVAWHSTDGRPGGLPGSRPGQEAPLGGGIHGPHCGRPERSGHVSG